MRMIIRDKVKMFDDEMVIIDDSFIFNFLISYRIHIILLLLFIYFLFSPKTFYLLIQSCMSHY